MRLFWLPALIWALLAGAVAAQCPEGDFPPFYTRATLFDEGLERSASLQPVEDIRGVIVPHHLEMPELLAGAVRMISGPQVTRVIVLFPDHFFQSTTPAATTTRDFQTIFGPVRVDAEAVQTLLADPQISDSCLFQREHGLRAVLPFMARLMPDVPIVPVAISINAQRAEWEALAARLRPLLTPGTVILQATDFSHYLPLHAARMRDQQVLNILAAGDAEAAAGLIQPDHVDSVGAMYISLRLLGEQGARPVVVANANMQELYERFIPETTSYVLAAFVPEGADVPVFRGETFLIGGDLFLGRVLPMLLSDELIRDRVTQAALAATGGRPLVLNLEGVLLPTLPARMNHMVLGMPADLLRDMASRLNVVAVSLANNHARDIGDSGLAETRAALDGFGIAHFGQGEVLRLKGAALVGLTDLDGRAVPSVDRLTPDLLDRAVLEDAETPVIAFVHWGREFVTDPGPREDWIAEELRQRGVAAVIGAHPHAVGPGPRILGGGDTVVLQSLGNFLFDQLPPHASGGLAEIRVFPQGTVFVRQLPLPNLFALTRDGN